MSKNTKTDEEVKNTEVKILLKRDTVMEKGFELKRDFEEYFMIKKRAAVMKIWYLDTIGQDFNNENWSVRYRYHDGCELELTYKKRFDTGIADSEKISSSDIYKRFLDNGFQAEYDKGYKENTLSFSYAVKIPHENKMELALYTAKNIALENCPRVLTGWKNDNWAINSLQRSRFYGPVDAREYKGSYNDLKIGIEIWKLSRYMPELSFDIKTGKAQETHDELIKILSSKNWFVPKDFLKTQMLYDESYINNPALSKYPAKSNLL